VQRRHRPVEFPVRLLAMARRGHRCSNADPRRTSRATERTDRLQSIMERRRSNCQVSRPTFNWLLFNRATVAFIESRRIGKSRSRTQYRWITNQAFHHYTNALELQTYLLQTGEQATINLRHSWRKLYVFSGVEFLVSTVRV
jgi:hypothetical protein